MDAGRVEAFCVIGSNALLPVTRKIKGLETAHFHSPPALESFYHRKIPTGHVPDIVRAPLSLRAQARNISGWVP